MRLSNLISLGMAIIVLCVSAIGGRVIMLEASRHERAEDGVIAARLAGLTLRAVTRLSLERGPTSHVLASESPLPPEQRRLLETVRSNTDAAFEAATVEARSADAAWAADIPLAFDAARRELAEARVHIDALTERASAERTEDALSEAIGGLGGIAPRLASSLRLMETRLAQADPDLTELFTAARVVTELREYASQLGTTMVSAVARRRPVSDAENARFEQLVGHLDALHDQLRIGAAKFAGNPAIERGLAETETHLFGRAVAMVRALAASGRATGDFGTTPEAFVAQYAPELQPVVDLRDAIVAAYTRRVEALLVDSTLSLAVAGVSVAMVLFIVGVIYRLVRVRVSRPLGAVSAALEQLARGAFDVPLAPPAAADEIGAVIRALDMFRISLGEKARDEANRRNLDKYMTQLLSERTADLERLTSELRGEIEQRIAVEAALEGHRDNLEREVAARTAALAASEAMLTEAIETIPDGFALFDPDDCLVMCNSVYREVYGLGAGVAKPGASFESILRSISASGAYRDYPDDFVSTRLAEHRAITDVACTHLHRLADGRWIEVRERRTRAGGIVGLRVDVTEARRRDAALGEQDKLAALGRLAGGVAHEINNLLQPALLLPEVVRERLGAADADSVECLDVVLESVRKARDIIRSVLLFARKEDPRLEIVDLAAEVRATLNFVQELLPAGTFLRQEIDRRGVLAAVNRTQLTQVLTNLVLNAVYASGAQAEIVVTLGQAMPSGGEAEALGLVAGGDYLTLAVADTGTGMDEATVARIFEPFFSTKPIGEGTGLGLSVVFGILQSWNGAITVDSALGRGTTFTLFVPVAAQAASVLAA